jgi:hypothetical protein
MVVYLEQKTKKGLKLAHFVMGSVLVLLWGLVADVFSRPYSDQSHTLVPRVYADIAASGGDSPSDGTGGDGGDGGGDNACGNSADNGCFTAGTKVLLANGKEKNIEDIEGGDVVRGENKNFTVVGLITHDGVRAFKHNFIGEPLMRVLLSSGRTLETVGGHPIYINDGGGFRWSNMFALKPGVLLIDSSGFGVEVVRVEYVSGEPVLYNLELAVNPGEERSYFANGVKVRDTQFPYVFVDRWLAPELVRTEALL